MKRTRREFIKMTGGVALGSSLVLAQLGKSAQAASPSKPLKGVPSTPLKVGVIAPLSGAAAIPGEQGWRASQIWVDDCNAAGGILGRKIELNWEDETTAKEAIEKFRKLTLQAKCDLVVGTISTAVALAISPVAEELGQLLLLWDGTTQKELDESMLNPKYVFRSCNNEQEAVSGAILTAEYFPNIKRVAGINPDYSYGRCCMEAFKTTLKHLNPNVEFVLELWPKYGTTDFTAHTASIRKEKADLLMTSFGIQEMIIFLKQAMPTGLFKETKLCMVSGGIVFDGLKKEFTPEGMILGFNSLYFNWTGTWPLLRDFTKKYQERFKAFPGNASDHAYFVLESYKAAVEKAYAFTGAWPTKEQVAKALPHIAVACPSGYRAWSHDKRMLCNFFMGITTHKNPYDFVTIDPVRVFSPAQIQTPPGMEFHNWIKGWSKA